MFLKYVCKVFAEFVKYSDSEPEHEEGHCPEVKRPPKTTAFPEPSLVKHTVSEAIYYIEHWIDLKYHKQLRTEHFLSIPHNGSEPYTYLQHEYTDDLSKITKKYIYSRSEINQSQCKDNIADDIINLKKLNIKKKPN